MKNIIIAKRLVSLAKSLVATSAFKNNGEMSKEDELSMELGSVHFNGYRNFERRHNSWWSYPIDPTDDSLPFIWVEIDADGKYRTGFCYANNVVEKEFAPQDSIFGLLETISGYQGDILHEVSIYNSIHKRDEDKEEDAEVDEEDASGEDGEEGGDSDDSLDSGGMFNVGGNEGGESDGGADGLKF